MDKINICKEIMKMQADEERVACFVKVSFEQFLKDFAEKFPQYSEAEIREIYDNLKEPERGTGGSAGYDFFAPVPFELKHGENMVIPTGFRCAIRKGWGLFLMPRSGSGFKFRIQLYNTIGVIDSDYFNAKNEGHIMVKLINDNYEGKDWSVGNDAFAQGIFLKYGITVDDSASKERTGGFGSTSK